jgi:murein hydrolase activator
MGRIDKMMLPCFPRFKIRVLFSLSIFLFGSHLIFANDRETQGKLTEQQLEQVNQKIAKVQQQLSADKSSQEKEQQALKQSEIELGHLHLKAQALNKDKRIIQSKISKLKEEELRLSNRNISQKQALHKDLQSIHAIGKQEKLKLLLNQENPEEIARILRYYDYYTNARVERIRSYQENIKNIVLNRQAIEQELAALEKIEFAIKQETENLNSKQQERKKILDALNKNIQTQDQQLKILLADQNRLSKLLDSLQGIWRDLPQKLDVTSLNKNKGKLKKPVEGKIRHHFGSERLDGRLKWNGILISAAMEQPVKAIHDGRVVFADWIRGYGLLIIIDHNDGFLSLYGHNASLLKEAGDWISSGEALATVGNSGGQYETGLYFELRKDGTPLNPKHWLNL